MKVKSSKFGQSVAILASDLFKAVPVRCRGFAVLKAGTPLTSTGAAALDGTDAAGILLYDVDPAGNPNGAMVVQGVVDYVKAKANAGITATAATLQAAMPDICFRTNVGASEEEDMAATVFVPFSVEITESGTLTVSTTAVFSDVLEAVLAKKNVTGVVTVAEVEQMFFSPVTAMQGHGESAVLLFSTVVDFDGADGTPAPVLCQIFFSADGCAIEAVDIAVKE